MTELSTYYRRKCIWSSVDHKILSTLKTHQYLAHRVALVDIFLDTQHSEYVQHLGMRSPLALDQQEPMLPSPQVREVSQDLASIKET